MHTPLFSIVIPTYNRSELVHGAIRSVLGQTFDDFEVVVSDNCSTDDTQQVVERFADVHDRFDADFLFSNLAEYRDRSFKGPQQNTVSCRAFSGETRVVSVD